ncbi:RNA polymerase sigma factor [Sphingobacterium rhinopitheci]|uniref:RNA polymerase sigma factor n=1 Tax=Sphingobacterium rhinopitheci TaxID=2781960 RepID=UPI001F521D0E|nr:sigma-70 family RNA polymerase sigma factor [Sphingobacterium rhinopitheci]MCI0920189.1 sigma-70 family RNA polymerase sigma factor [Sphingobacterium rhinopitheci]
MPIEASDHDIIQGIVIGDNRTISRIYKLYYPAIARMIINNNGTEDEAKDIFQESVLVLYNKVTQKQFELSSKLSTFLYAVSRRLWLKQLTRKGSVANSSDISDYEDILQVEEDMDKHQENEAKFDKMNLALQELGEPCKTLLKDFYIKNLSMKDIQEKFGYTNTDNAKTQKYKCLQRLKKIYFNINI